MWRQAKNQPAMQQCNYEMNYPILPWEIFHITVPMIHSQYPLVNVYITMENHHFSLKNSISMAMFNSYVKNKMKPRNPNAHTYVNGTDVNTHGYAVTHNTFLQ